MHSELHFVILMAALYFYFLVPVNAIWPNVA